MTATCGLDVQPGPTLIDDLEEAIALSALLAVRAKFVVTSDCGQSQAWTDYNKLQPDTARKAMHIIVFGEQAGGGIAAS